MTSTLSPINVNTFDNYRPISLLPSISKIFERTMYDQIYNYFQNNELFYNSQYGFRKNNSTELATLEIIYRIIQDMDKYNTPINIYILTYIKLSTPLITIYC